MLIFDIETEPLPLDELAPLIPEFDPTTVKGIVQGEFDPASVKTGNLKDVAKIAAKVEEARAAHEAAKANAPQLIEAARAKHQQDFLDRAALSATTGRVLVIGYLDTIGGKLSLDDGKANDSCDAELPSDEVRLLQRFWRTYLDCKINNRLMIGVNIEDFDLPFLIRRSWMLGIDVPAMVISQRRYFDPMFVDLSKTWLLGQRIGGGESASFDAIARAMGTGGKLTTTNGLVNPTDGTPLFVTGESFHRFWNAGDESRSAAAAYLENDLRQPSIWAMRMGVGIY